MISRRKLFGGIAAFVAATPIASLLPAPMSIPEIDTEPFIAARMRQIKIIWADPAPTFFADDLHEEDAG
jgi:hypothetical protein